MAISHFSRDARLADRFKVRSKSNLKSSVGQVGNTTTKVSYSSLRTQRHLNPR